MNIDFSRCIIIGKTILWDKSNPEGALGAEVIREIKSKFLRLVEQDREKEIFFYFGECPGGEIEEALMLACMLESSKTPTVAIVDGDIASAASVVCFGCKRRIGVEGCSIGLHSISYYFSNLIVPEIDMELAATRSNILKTYTKLLDFITRRTGLSREIVASFFQSREDEKFNLHYSLVHGLLTEEATLTT